MIFLSNFRHWQENALEKLKARESFKEKQQIHLKLKWTKNFGFKADDQPPSKIEVPADFMGKNLAQTLSAMTDQDAKSLKMICSGRVLTEDDLLTSQNVKPGAVIMVAKIDRDDGTLKVLEEQKDILQKTKDDAVLLGSGSGDRLEILSKCSNLPSPSSFVGTS